MTSLSGHTAIVASASPLLGSLVDIVENGVQNGGESLFRAEVLNLPDATTL